MRRWCRSLAGSLRAVGLCALVVFAPAVVAAAEVPSWLREAADGFIAFPDLTLTQPFDADDDDFDANPGLDMFYARDFGRLRFLVEGFVDRHEQELERLQVGWLVGSDTTVWGGRFHSPIGYWNTEYHHGTYLQTSISRPGIIEFEDRGGPLPLHVSGAMVQGAVSAGGSEFVLEMAVGAGPQLTDDGLEPFDFFDPAAHTHDLSSSLRLAWRPNPIGASEIGAFFGAAKVPGEHAIGIDDARLVFGGAYGRLDSRWLDLLGAGYAVSDRVEPFAGRAATGLFPAGYLQAELVPIESFRIYGRFELSGNTASDPYLALFPDFVRRAFLGGVRWDVTARQAVKIEFGDRTSISQQYRSLLVQWSAAFP